MDAILRHTKASVGLVLPALEQRMLLVDMLQLLLSLRMIRKLSLHVYTHQQLLR